MNRAEHRDASHSDLRSRFSLAAKRLMVRIVAIKLSPQGMHRTAVDSIFLFTRSIFDALPLQATIGTNEER